MQLKTLRDIGKHLSSEGRFQILLSAPWGIDSRTLCFSSKISAQMFE